MVYNIYNVITKWQYKFAGNSSLEHTLHIKTMNEILVVYSQQMYTILIEKTFYRSDFARKMWPPYYVINLIETLMVVIYDS